MSEIKPTSGVDDRVRLAEIIPLLAPFTLNVFPTNLCNLKCSYCAQSLGWARLESEYAFSSESMSLDTLMIAIEQAKEFSAPFKLVSMMGHGEPLLNPHLPEMISIVKRAGIAGRIDVITNALLLTKEKSLALIEAGLDVIRISLQGLSSDMYKRTSNVTPDYDKFLENISFFYANKKQCRVFVKVMDAVLCFGEEDKFYSMFRNISDRMYIDKIKPVYDGVAYSEKVADVRTDRYGRSHEKRHVCPQPFYMLSLWPDGEVTPCDAIYKANLLGNVHRGNLVEMWNSENLLKFSMLQLQKKRTLHDACCRCCAPDDVSHPLDVLDGDAELIIERYNNR
jgi:GTP 3',8-cyclase